VKPWPAIVNVAVRELVAAFAWTENWIVPLPIPDAPVVSVIQVGSPLTVQVQLADVLRLTLLPPPAALRDTLVFEREKVQGAPCCVTVNGLAPIIKVALRDTVAVLGCTLKRMDALPAPLETLLRLIQAGNPVTLQVQFAEVLKLTLAFPPASPIEAVAAESA
jgi:hypothetical protein